MKKIALLITQLTLLFVAGCSMGNNNNHAEAGNTPKESQTPTMEDKVDYAYYIDSQNFTVQSFSSDESSPLVLLTFDDAPYGNSLEIADALEEAGVGAIFFVNSMYIEDERGKAAVKDLYNRGFEIGNHTHTHQTLTEASEEKQYEEIITTNDMIEDIIGVRPRFFRAPHGVYTNYSLQVVASENMQAVNWTYGYDWMPEYHQPQALVDITLNTELLGGGANILMHDREWTAAAVPDIIAGLQTKGYDIIDPKLIDHTYVESEDLNA